MFNKSASRAIEVMELLAFSDKPLNMTEIGRNLNLPKSSCFELLQTLINKGMLEQDNRDSTFHLTIKVFQIGATVYAKTELNKAASEFIKKLAAVTGETVYLAAVDKSEIVYLDKVESDEPIRSTLPIGSRNHMHITGLGKAILSTYSFEKVRRLIGDRELPVKTKNSINNISDLLLDMEATRKRGYAIDDRESTEFLRCIAAPILDYKGEAIAAVSVAALDSRLTNEKIPQYAADVTETAMQISKKLGFSKNKLYWKDQYENFE